MKTEALERYLNSFGKQVVKEAKGNLAKADKAGALQNSINFFVIKKGNTVTVRFKMASYGKYVDKGVSGNKVKRSYIDTSGKKVTSPYKYTNKQPPASMIQKWIKRKGLETKGLGRGRDKKTGQYVSNLAFFIARSIKSKGIQGISFFSKPVMLGMKNFSKGVGKSLKQDILKNLQ
tara:strand:+ start:292 stop:819 length:528 start_codon:yes stop_codon:yes gene_type:complete